MAVVLGDMLRYPQCAVKFEILQLCFQEKLICNENMNDIWTRLVREDQAVVKSTHRILAKMACGLPPKELDKFFECIQVKGRGEK